MVENQGYLVGLLGIVLGIVLLFSDQASAGGLDLFSADLSAAQSRLQQSREQLELLGRLPLRQTATQAGVQLRMRPDPPPQAPWIQLDLGRVQTFDRIMIVPAMIGEASSPLQPFAFPKRFRVDVSESESFAAFKLLYDSQDVELDTTNPLPVVIETPGTQTRYLRITVTELAKVTDRWTYALSEVALIHGDRNVAVDAKVTMTESISLPPVWDASYLVDSRTPLGPPIQPARSNVEFPLFDGVFCKSDDVEQELWFQIDMGRVETVEVIRLFPVHARQGADLPGYGFPLRFRIEGSDEPLFEQPVILFRTSEDFTNPGSNPVVLRLPGNSLRYLRIVSERGSIAETNKFGFAEVQVLRGNENLAANKTVTALHWMDKRPLELLVDGDASYGEIMTLDDWSSRWLSVRTIQDDIRSAEHSVRRYTTVAQRRVAWAGIGFVALAGTGLLTLVFNGRRRRARQRAAFRMRLAQDLHDEIGSNLAAIARLSEVGQSLVDAEELKEDWRSVGELASECTESMRETLWLLGGPKRDGGTLAERLPSIATRMLSAIEVHWDIDDAFAQYQPGEATEREVVLVFKAILANITRSSYATEVKVDVGNVSGQWRILVEDNGNGFDADAWEKRMEPRGMGLESMKARVKELGGTLKIDSEPGRGTRLTIHMRA